MALILFTSLGCSQPPPAREDLPEDLAEGAPRLVLLVAVDQLRAQSLDQFDELWTGGFRRLLDEGTVFTQAEHAHAATETAPGHATLATGSHPRSHGLIANNWFDAEAGEWVYSVGDEEHDRSPHRLLRSTVGDWLKDRSPRSRVFAVSRKDRAAILLGGRRADAAFWYDSDSGGFESSSFYEAVPDWLWDYEDPEVLALFGTAWSPLREDLQQEAASRWDIRQIELGPSLATFPHAFGGLDPVPGESFFDSVGGTPFADEAVARFALNLIEREDLGNAGRTDLLALSFSALDSVGHTYGPNSPEAFDTLLRLDQTLGWLLEQIDAKLGTGATVLALSSDHGAMPVPEWLVSRGEPGGRVSDEQILCNQALFQASQERFGADLWLPGRVMASEAVAELGLSAAEVETFAREQLEQCPHIERVWTASELAGALPSSDSSSVPFWKTYHPERSPHLLIQYREFFLPTRYAAASHGSAWMYDRAAPLIFWGTGVPAARREERVATVDLAPSLAQLGLFEAETGVDGHSLFGLSE